MTHDENILYSQALHTINTMLSALRVVAANLAPVVGALPEGASARQYAENSMANIMEMQAYLIACTAQQAEGAGRITYEGPCARHDAWSVPAGEAAPIVIH